MHVKVITNNDFLKINISFITSMRVKLLFISKIKFYYQKLCNILIYMSIKKSNYSIFNLLLFSFFIFSCSNNNFAEANLNNFNAEDIKFDVVEKSLSFDGTLPNISKNYLKNLFDNNLKTDGFEGSLSIFVLDFKNETSDIEDGKKVNLSFNYKLNIQKKYQSSTKSISGAVSEFVTITGDFSLNDLENLVAETEKNIIKRFWIQLSNLN